MNLKERLWKYFHISMLIVEIGTIIYAISTKSFLGGIGAAGLAALWLLITGLTMALQKTQPSNQSLGWGFVGWLSPIGVFIIIGMMNIAFKHLPVGIGLVILVICLICYTLNQMAHRLVETFGYEK